MRLKLALGIGCAFFASSVLAQNTVWKCVGPDGRPQYTNVQRDAQGRNCSVVAKEVTVVPGFKPQQSSGSYPKVDAETQRTRDESRRKILQDELSQEEQRLADARAKLAEQEAVRLGDEKNYQKVLDRLQPYKDAVGESEKNVSAIRKELGNLK